MLPAKDVVSARAHPARDMQLSQVCDHILQPMDGDDQTSPVGTTIFVSRHDARLTQHCVQIQRQ